MRGTALALAACALVILATSPDAEAQKKKRPKRPPKTQQPADDAPVSRDPPDHPPPPIDTTLKESAPVPVKRESEREPPTPKSVSTWLSRPLMVGVTAGYASENLRIGFGMRLGYSLLDELYIGLAFTYQLGVKIGELTFRGFYPALELGHEWHFDAITVRPYAGIGPYFAQVSGAGVSDTGDGYLSLYPGISADYQIANTPGFIGVDTRLLLIFGAETDPNPSLGVFAVGGMRF